MIDAIDLRLGRWQDVLQGVEQVDAVITDPPFGKRTHNGHDGARSSDGADREDIPYHPWTAEDVRGFVLGAPKCRGWFVSMTSHDLIPAWENAHRECGRYVFAPLPALLPGMSCRRAGDGPSSWTIWIIVARPKTVEFARWGTLDGGYHGSPQSEFPGGKPLWLKRAIIRDYTRPGDLVCDPCSGMATTLIAAAIEGRRAVGAECCEETYLKAKRRIEAGYTPLLPFKEAL